MTRRPADDKAARGGPIAKAVMSGRGNLTLPRALRIALRLHGGDAVEFVETAHGWLVRATQRMPGGAHKHDEEHSSRGAGQLVNGPAREPTSAEPSPAEMPRIDTSSVETAPAVARAPDIAATAPDYEVLPTVMVVDDSLTVRKVAQRLLEREGYQVVLATDGVDALKQLQAVTPHVLMVDVEMPRMDGFEFARTVRASSALHGVPIVIVSSYTDAEHRATAREIGVDAYVGKPYDAAELLAHIRHFMNQSRHAAHT